MEKIPWRREWLPTPVFLPGESRGQRSLVGYSPWCHKELDTAEWLTLSLFIASHAVRDTCNPYKKKCFTKHSSPATVVVNSFWNEGQLLTNLHISSVQLFSCVWLCDPMDCSTPGFPVHHQVLELAQTHVHQVGNPIQPSHPLWSPSPPAFNLSQHQGILKWVSSSHKMAKVLEIQLQHQSFQWKFRTDFL